jgi:hypothetical protein
LHVVVYGVVGLGERVEGVTGLGLGVVWHCVVVEGGEDGFVAFPALKGGVVGHSLLVWRILLALLPARLHRLRMVDSLFMIGVLICLMSIGFCPVPRGRPRGSVGLFAGLRAATCAFQLVWTGTIGPSALDRVPARRSSRAMRLAAVSLANLGVLFAARVGLRAYEVVTVLGVGGGSDGVVVRSDKRPALP